MSKIHGNYFPINSFNKQIIKSSFLIFKCFEFFFTYFNLKDEIIDKVNDFLDVYDIYDCIGFTVRTTDSFFNIQQYINFINNRGLQDEKIFASFETKEDKDVFLEGISLKREFFWIGYGR